jgi:hypothetical protein
MSERYVLVTLVDSDVFAAKVCSLKYVQLRQNIEECIVHVLPKLYQGTAVRREDMTARTIIAKLVAFLFVQDSVRSSTK